MRSLAIISHTVHCRTKSGHIIGWEPTIREINHLTTIFDKIYHIAPLHKRGPLNAMDSYKGNKIKFVPLIPSGGKHIKDKLSVLWVLPNNYRKILNVIRDVDWIHFRAPCNLGIYVLPLLSIMKHDKMWIKYAGNWKKKDIPFTYILQRWWLKKNFQNAAVTINGFWKNQGKHLLTFNNPCISDEELNLAHQVGQKKCFSNKINICFVGRADHNKGVKRLIKALEIINSRYGLENWINEINIIGGDDGSDDSSGIENNSPVKWISILGWLNREKLNQIYSKSHFLILPTKSEGFPKVIPEAAAFGCIPVVTDIPPINQYIMHNKNGILLKSSSTDDIIKCLLEIQKQSLDYKNISLATMDLAQKFTFNYYISRLESEILHD